MGLGLMQGGQLAIQVGDLGGGVGRVGPEPSRPDLFVAVVGLEPRQFSPILKRAPARRRRRRQREGAAEKDQTFQRIGSGSVPMIG
jgi:hypothetical protein